MPQLFVKARSGVFGLFLSLSHALYAKIVKKTNQVPVLGHTDPKSSTPATGSGEETTEARLQRLPTTPRADSSTGIPWNVCVTRVPGERQAVLYKRGDRSYVWEITTKIVANLLDTHHAHGITNQRNEIEMLHILGELHGGMKCMNQTTLNINNWRHNMPNPLIYKARPYIL